MMGYDKSIICIFKMSFLNYVADLEEWYFFFLPICHSTNQEDTKLGKKR